MNKSRKPAVEKRLKREKERRTEEILQAARNVILDKNFSGATMDDIAAEAGITKPTIYQYFSTKDELFVRMIEPMIESLATKLEEIRNNLSGKKYITGKTIVKDVFNVYYSTFEKDPDLFRLFNIFLQVGIVNKMNKEAALIIKKWGKKSFEEGNLIVAAAVEQGLFREIDIHHTTDFVWGSFWGIVQVEQNKWGREGISRFLKPVLEYAENLLITALVKK
ncbi:MAG TPA: TetR/AcrR family transcriptional regulator [Spirochaetota bacterium]|nr:TetR/AcrR family transcriptional regulator [Spirochaetota bacterium]HPJ34212.1 TetR/AcrR family transcriptional regulator [Spirochaetota bacterium]